MDNSLVPKGPTSGAKRQNQISMAVDKETFNVLVQSKGDEPRVYIGGLVITLSKLN
jgi:hypothetical protein